MDEHLKNVLKRNQFRTTPQRIGVLRVISNEPQSVEEVFRAVSKKIHTIDLASVYRTLALFIKLSLVRVVNFGDGKDRYEILNTGKHHHHVVCTACGKIADVELADEKRLEQIASKKTNYRITSHSLEFFGVCHECHLA